jgi:hypothetical protein
MSETIHHPSFTEAQPHFPGVHLSYECITQERSREASTILYEIACSITYPTATAHLSVRVSTQHTYRNTPTREILFTRHEAGATTYVELHEREQLEIRIVEQDGTYAKAIYYAHGQALIERDLRGITSTLQKIDAQADTGEN